MLVVNSVEIDIDDFYIKVGKRVKILRDKYNISQLELSLLIGHKSTSTVGSAEIYKNRVHFNLEHIVKICKVFEITLEEFFNFGY